MNKESVISFLLSVIFYICVILPIVTAEDEPVEVEASKVIFKNFK